MRKSRKTEIFIHSSLIWERDLNKKKAGDKINISFSDRNFSYSPFRYYDINSQQWSGLEIGVRKKIENEWRFRIECLSQGLKEFDETYEKIFQNIKKKETIRESITKITRENTNPKEERENFGRLKVEVNNDPRVASEMELSWFNRRVLVPTRKFLQNLTEKKEKIIETLKGLETDYQATLNAETHNQELRKIPERIKEIQELLNFFLANETNSQEEIDEINRLLGRFQEIREKTEKFIQNHPPTPPVPSPKTQEKEQESPIEHSENPENKSPEEQKNSGSKPLIFLLIIVAVALLSVPIYYFFSERGKRKQIQTRKRKTSQLTTS